MTLARHAVGVRPARDPAVAWIADRQRGLVTFAQLQACGLSRDAIRHRVARGRLVRLHRGVYLVGHGAAPEGAHELAAVLACGEHAVLSQHDRVRDARLGAAGIEVLRFTWRRITRHPEAVAATLGRELATAGTAERR